MRSIPRLFPRSLGRFARFLAALAALAVLVGALVAFPRPALAGGRVTLASREVAEVDGRWKLNMTIDYGSIPSIPHIPMLFKFTPTMLYERALTDKSPDKPVVNRLPLSNQADINESMDVGFADASGKVFKITKFDFVIRRDHGFEAGEYDLKIVREDDGVQMGQTIQLILKGDNVVIDRRAMVFGTNGKLKKVKEDKPADDKDKKDDADEKKPAADDEKKADDDAKPADAPPPVPPKQGGCGCRVAGDEAPGPGVALVAFGAALAIAARRSRRRGASRQLVP